MTLTAGHAVVFIPVEDEQGDRTGEVLPVEVEYGIERWVEGEDADGRRGLVCEQIVVLDCAIDPDDMARANPTIEQVADVLARAKRRIEERQAW
ncbi:MAG: hypothetical protein KGL39_18580 [Patescibacteria group bacterium]|nr:hypothetical protein [Patescibacteria group bacterium]